jgi:hypothetical protein
LGRFLNNNTKRENRMATPKKEIKPAKVEFRVANSIIELGARYTLDYRPDPSAPEGMKEMTKFPFEGNEEVEKIYFSEERRQYDTGFYTESPCLNIIPADIRPELVAMYEKYIKHPYEKQFNVNLSPEEANTFWKTYQITGDANKQFDTTKLNDLVELFYILKMGLACEKDEKLPSLRKDAKFILSSPSKVKNKSKEQTNLRRKTYLKFNALLSGDRDKVNLILEWMGKDNTSKIDVEDLDSIYFQVINDPKTGLDFCELFTKAVAEYETEIGREKMEYMFAIKRLLALRKIKIVRGRYVTSDQEIFLGNTLQDITGFCIIDNSVQSSVIKELMIANPVAKRPEHIAPKIV